MEKKYTSAQVRRIVNLNQRQLDYWHERGVASPNLEPRQKGSRRRGRGKRRYYSFDDLVRLKVIKQLRDAGLPLDTIAKAVQNLKKRSLDGHPLDEVLVTDGKKFQWKRKDGKVEDLLKDRQFVFGVLALHEIEVELRSVLKLDAGQNATASRARRARSG